MSVEVDETHDPLRRSWVPGADEHEEFPVQNLPFGVFSPGGGARRGGVAIGDHILDLAGLSRSETIDRPLRELLRVAEGPTLNPLLAIDGASRWKIRRGLSELLSREVHRGKVLGHLHRSVDCNLHLPARVGNYTDFYVGIHHATNVGRLFRPDNPLLPNYKHVPIGYHGRASSVRVSGTTLVRPNGQRKLPDADLPDFGPTRRLDMELELGLWIASGNDLGQPIPITAAGDQIAGLCLLNDWSARDLQAWEYQPLGPFLSKNFLTTVSPWIVTAEALAPFRVAQSARPEGDPEPLSYLMDPADQERGGFAIRLEAALDTTTIRAAGEPPVTISRSAAHHMYWTAAQLIAHHSSNGCDLQPGDLLGTGTISTPDEKGLGSLLELTSGGIAPLRLPNGETRTFLEDGDRVILRGWAERDGYRTIGFGPCVGTVAAAQSSALS